MPGSDAATRNGTLPKADVEFVEEKIQLLVGREVVANPQGVKRETSMYPGLDGVRRGRGQRAIELSEAP